ncbi:MAG: stage II sporulation protein M [Methanobacteriaceae archaeon]|nr:stage II sporulation protein M [Methanobacteriaceae archaeon]MDP3485866.1 stage II sporulation protein M [Methanobacteriaceae archaeon]
MVKKERHESTLNAIYKHNEKYFALSAVIFFGSMFIGYLHLLDFLMVPLQQQFKKSIMEGQIKIETFSLFFSNLEVLLKLFAGGIALGSITAIFIFINGAFIGYFATQAPLADFILLTIPHGIFEIISFIIAGGAGFRLANFVYTFLRDLIEETWYGSFWGKLEHVYNNQKDQLTESIILLGIAILLLLIAAVIEANFTIAWYQYIKGNI